MEIWGEKTRVTETTEQKSSGYDSGVVLLLIFLLVRIVQVRQNTADGIVRRWEDGFDGTSTGRISVGEFPIFPTDGLYMMMTGNRQCIWRRREPLMCKSGRQLATTVE